MKRLIKNFKEVSKSDAQIAGGKGASLGEMTQAGVPVPPGFVVLSEAFEQFLSETDLNVEIEAILKTVDNQKMHTVENASEEIQALILQAKMPEDIAKEIQENFKKLDAKFVAVRSSATAEDGAEAAWAGQLDSYLNTNQEALLRNVQKCWASLFTPRAIFYRFEKKLHKQKISVAVVIQKMIQSEISGIAFSVHPVTEDYNQMIIEAGFGLGEAIVSGSITPDAYVVSKSSRKIEDINISQQSKGLFRKESGGNVWQDIPEKEGKKQKLTKKQILELSDLIMKIEDHYQFPVDIEWAYENKKFYIVQSRPITTLFKKEDVIDGKLIKYMQRDYKLRDLSITFWSLLNPNFLKEIYYKEALYVMNRGLVTSYIRSEDAERINNDLSEAIKRDSGYISNALKEGVRTLALVKRTAGKNICEGIIKKDALKLFEEAENSWNQFGIFFEFTHALGRIDAKLSKAQIDRLSKFHNDRKSVFLDFFKFLENLCLSVSSNDPKIKQKNLAYLTIPEIKKYLTGKLDCQEINRLQSSRQKGYLYHAYSAKKEGEIISDLKGIRAKELLSRIDSEENSELAGVSVSSGKVTGEVKIISLNTKLKNEDVSRKIIVTTMTTPSMDIFLKKVRGIVTEEGGALCHAAIFAREAKIPTITLVKNITNILKDGDLVEVDANEGVVRVLKRKS
ncbi:MAG: PEP/pyruvate-binding domain-containing protein [Candidatus Moraniibacteriota bacterium]